MNNSGLVIFGEVLFDHFPDGSRVLGGAPFNVAWHLQAFGQAPLFVSCVGRDDEGMVVRSAMQSWGMAVDGLQTNPELPTGRVEVKIADGEPAYEILYPAAFDAIAKPAIGPECCRSLRLLYHGSLALREPRSVEALDAIVALKPDMVFVDVNLRSPWWQRSNVLQLADKANWVKLNRHELDSLSPSEEGAAGQVERFIRDHRLDGVLLTRGGEGAELFTREGAHDSIQPNGRIEPVDTVGAGDAFTAVAILGLALGWPRQLILARAQDFASAVCSQRGATTDDRAFYRPFLNQWSKEK